MALTSYDRPMTEAERNLIKAALAWRGDQSTWWRLKATIDRVRHERDHGWDDRTVDR